MNCAHEFIRLSVMILSNYRRCLGSIQIVMNTNDRPFQETEYPVEVTVVQFQEPSSYFYIPRNGICSEFVITSSKTHHLMPLFLRVTRLVS